MKSELLDNVRDFAKENKQAKLMTVGVGGSGLPTYQYKSEIISRVFLLIKFSI